MNVIIENQGDGAPIGGTFTIKSGFATVELPHDATQAEVEESVDELQAMTRDIAKHPIIISTEDE